MRVGAWLFEVQSRSEFSSQCANLGPRLQNLYPSKRSLNDAYHLTLLRDTPYYPSRTLCKAVMSGPALHDGRRASTLPSRMCA